MLLIPRWTATGAGGRPEGFNLEVGKTFRYVAQPKPGWSASRAEAEIVGRGEVIPRYAPSRGGGGGRTDIRTDLRVTLRALRTGVALGVGGPSNEIAAGPAGGNGTHMLGEEFVDAPVLSPRGTPPLMLWSWS